MSFPINLYLKTLRTQLATVLMPKDDAASKKVAIYCHRILSMLILRTERLPALQQKAVAEVDKMLDDLIAELGQIEGGTVVISELIAHVRARPDWERVEPILQNAAQLFSQHPTPSRLHLMGGLAAITCDIESSINQAAIDEDLGEAVEEKHPELLNEQQTAALQAFLRRKFPDESALEVGAIRVAVGGGSKVTLIVELRHAVRLPARVVVRIDKSAGVTETSVANEYVLIETVHAAGLRVPQPFALETDRSVIGAPFIVVSCVEGHNIGDWIDVNEPTRAFAVTLAHTMARLHQIPVDGLADRLPGGRISTRERMAEDIERFERSWRVSGTPSLALEQGYAWMKSHMELAEGRRSIIHGDIGCHNMLGHDGDLAALLDWETAVIGNPAQDIAYARHTIEQMMPWEDWLAEYQKAGGIIPSQGEMDYYRVWRGAFSVHYNIMARSVYQAGMVPIVLLAYASQRLYNQCYLQLHEAVKHVYSRY